MAKGTKTGGRKAGVPNKATVEIRALAREYGPNAIKELARLANEAQSEQAASPPAMRCLTEPTVAHKQAN